MKATVKETSKVSGNVTASTPYPFRLYSTNQNGFAVRSSPMVDDFGESNTDKSFYRPDVSQVRSFLGTGMQSSKKLMYDFPDGKDTGEEVQTFVRNKGLDITEVDTAVEVIKQAAKAKIDKAKADEQSEKTITALEKQFGEISKIAEALAPDVVAESSDKSSSSTK